MSRIEYSRNLRHTKKSKLQRQKFHLSLLFQEKVQKVCTANHHLLCNQSHNALGFSS